MEIILRRLATDYLLAMQEQQEACDIVNSQINDGVNIPSGFLFIGEHAPVYTIGRNGDTANLLVAAGRDGVPTLFRADRGGDITYHGPGQLVVYLVVHLPSLHIGAKCYVEKLQNVVLDTLSEFRIVGQILSDAPGVWLPQTRMRPLRKICALGIHISHGITTHGIALNVQTDLSYFEKINPCGFTDRGVTSIQQEMYAPLESLLVQEALLKHFANHFDFSYVRGGGGVLPQ